MAARQRGKTPRPPSDTCTLCSGTGWITETLSCGCPAGAEPPMEHYRRNHPHKH